MHRLQYTGDNNVDVKFKNYSKQKTEFSGSVSTSSCLS